MPLSELKALKLLEECTGDHIWSIEHCRLRGVPAQWVAELVDAFESGFEDDLQTIYVNDRPTNQYQGVRDVDLAKKIGSLLGVDVEDIESGVYSRAALVVRIQEAVEED